MILLHLEHKFNRDLASACDRNDDDAIFKILSAADLGRKRTVRALNDLYERLLESMTMNQDTQLQLGLPQTPDPSIYELDAGNVTFLDTESSVLRRSTASDHTSWTSRWSIASSEAFSDDSETSDKSEGRKSRHRSLFSVFEQDLVATTTTVALSEHPHIVTLSMPAKSAWRGSHPMPLQSPERLTELQSMQHYSPTPSPERQKRRSRSPDALIQLGAEPLQRRAQSLPHDRKRSKSPEELNLVQRLPNYCNVGPSTPATQRSISPKPQFFACITAPGDDLTFPFELDAMDDDQYPSMESSHFQMPDWSPRRSSSSRFSRRPSTLESCSPTWQPPNTETSSIGNGTRTAYRRRSSEFHMQPLGLEPARPPRTGSKDLEMVTFLHRSSDNPPPPPPKDYPRPKRQAPRRPKFIDPLRINPNPTALGARSSSPGRSTSYPSHSSAPTHPPTPKRSPTLPFSKFYVGELSSPSTPRPTESPCLEGPPSLPANWPVSKEQQRQSTFFIAESPQTSERGSSESSTRSPPKRPNFRRSSTFPSAQEVGATHRAAHAQGQYRKIQPLSSDLRPCSTLSNECSDPSMLPQATSFNNYLGFCACAWRYQSGATDAMQRYSRQSQHAEQQVLACANTAHKCAFALDVGLPSPHCSASEALAANIWEAHGVRFRPEFLAKYHVRAKKRLLYGFQFQCPFCILMREEVHPLYGANSFVRHIAHKHRKARIPRTVLERTRCVLGRYADDQEEFDINLPGPEEYSYAKGCNMGLGADFADPSLDGTDVAPNKSSSLTISTKLAKKFQVPSSAGALPGLAMPAAPRAQPNRHNPASSDPHSRNKYAAPAPGRGSGGKTSPTMPGANAPRRASPLRAPFPLGTSGRTPAPSGSAPNSRASPVQPQTQPPVHQAHTQLYHHLQTHTPKPPPHSPHHQPQSRAPEPPHRPHHHAQSRSQPYSPGLTMTAPRSVQFQVPPPPPHRDRDVPLRRPSLAAKRVDRTPLTLEMVRAALEDSPRAVAWPGLA